MTKRFVTSEIETHVFESGPDGVCEFKICNREQSALAELKRGMK